MSKDCSEEIMRINIDNNKLITITELMDYSWRYFEFHANQRISLINFFIILSTILTIALASTFQSEYEAYIIGFTLGLLLICVSIIFYKLEERNKYLIHHGEKALKYFESQIKSINEPNESSTDNEFNPFLLFTIEEKQTELLRKNQKEKKVFFRQLSFSTNLKLFFLLFGLIGLLGMLFSIVLIIDELDLL